MIDAQPELLGDVTEQTVAAELACHYKNAHELAKSLGASVRAGVAAKRVYAYEVAQKQFERALELWPRVPDAEERAGMDHAEVLRRAATCAGARGEGSRAVALIRQALENVDPAAEPSRAAGLYERLGNFLRTAGESGASFAAFDRAVALLPPTPSAERARVLETRSRVEMLLGEYDQALATVTQALDEARAVGDEAIEVRALNTLGFTKTMLGDEEAGIASLREAYARATSPGDRSRAAINLSEALDLAGHTEEALALVRAELDEVRSTARAVELRRLRGAPGGQLPHPARPARRGAGAAPHARAGRGDLLRVAVLARVARPARGADRRSRRAPRRARRVRAAQ